jgi:hypothetical protein
MENLLPMFLSRYISKIYKNTSKGATCRRLREELHTEGRLDFFHLFHLLCRETGLTRLQAFCAKGFHIEPATCSVRSICSKPSRHRSFGEVDRTLGYFQSGEAREGYKVSFSSSIPENPGQLQNWTNESWPNTRNVSGESILA